MSAEATLKDMIPIFMRLPSMRDDARHRTYAQKSGASKGRTGSAPGCFGDVCPPISVFQLKG